MSRAFQLGYVEFGTPQPELELRYYAEVIGATETERGSDGAAYLSLGLDHHNVIVRPSDQAGMRCFGLQITADVSLDDAAKRIRGHVPAGVPKSVVDKLSNALGKTLSEPIICRGFRRRGSTPLKDMDKEKLALWLAAKRMKEKEIIERAGIQPERGADNVMKAPRFASENGPSHGKMMFGAGHFRTSTRASCKE